MEGASEVLSRMSKSKCMLFETEGVQMSWSEGEDGRCGAPLQLNENCLVINSTTSVLLIRQLGSIGNRAVITQYVVVVHFCVVVHFGSC
jgi:hypothetical protein